MIYSDKLLWKIEELWEKYFIKNISCSEFIPKPKVLFKTNTCPANKLELKDITESNSPFSFYTQKVIKDIAIPAKAGIQNIKKFYKNNISLYNLDFKFVSRFDFDSSEKPVHVDEYSRYFGLKKSQVLEKDGKFIYLFDNHNKIIQPFLEYREIIGKGFDVVHIDAHDDNAVFAGQKLRTLELKKVQDYITQTRISDFFDFFSEAVISTSNTVIHASHSVIPVKAGIQDLSKNTLDSSFRGSDNFESKLINKIYRYTKSIDFREFKKPKNPYILSLDIDIFGPEGDFVDLESKVKTIVEAWRDAEIVCIATSPGFIDQKYAQGIIEIFVK